jgi:hypothetical protein
MEEKYMANVKDDLMNLKNEIYLRRLEEIIVDGGKLDKIEEINLSTILDIADILKIEDIELSIIQNIADILNESYCLEYRLSNLYDCFRHLAKYEFNNVDIQNMLNQYNDIINSIPQHHIDAHGVHNSVRVILKVYELLWKENVSYN